MSTQHPDNVNMPFFAENSELGGDDEIQEAYYAFSHLGCDEQMWDCEGKEVDDFVVKKLLTKYEPFFRDNILGRDRFITLRVPNPTVERAEAKILLETLESIPRSFDAAKMFYGSDVPPIFEVILPMTASYKCLDRVYRYYSDFVVGKQHRPFRDADITIAEWIGEFKPERINVIPLFEDMEHMLDAHNITGMYLKDKKVEQQRVFLARSDPAMNYGLVSAVLLNKIALQRLNGLSIDTGVHICPIIGVGSAPFRGNFKPGNVLRTADEYPSVCTFTIQSAFKYDNDPAEVSGAVAKLKGKEVSLPQQVEDGRCLEMIEKYLRAYQQQIAALAPLINRIAEFVPSRRKRKLHIGLFGYSRNMGEIRLPRAISFTSSLYSMGLPPEILGLNALNRDDCDFLRDTYLNFDRDMKDALKYLNPGNVFVPEGLLERIEALGIEYGTEKEHKDVTDHVLKSLKDDKPKNLQEHVLRAAHIRGFLG